MLIKNDTTNTVIYFCTPFLPNELVTINDPNFFLESDDINILKKLFLQFDHNQSINNDFLSDDEPKIIKLTLHEQNIEFLLNGIKQKYTEPIFLKRKDLVILPGFMPFFINREL